MSLFNFGSSKQSSQSTSLDFGLSGSESRSFARGTSQQQIAFADLFQNLYGGASSAAARAAGDASLFQGEAEQLFSGGLEFLEQLQAAGPASEYMNERLTGPDAAAEAQLGVLGTELGNFFNEQLAPGIRSSGIAAGTFGGSRGGVNLGLAAKEVAGQFATGAASILSSSQAQRDTLAATMGSQNIQAGGTGLAALPGILGLAEAGANASLSPYLTLSQILGGPTVLTSAEDIAGSLAKSFGLTYGTSQSTSKGKSLSFGFGGMGATS